MLLIACANIANLVLVRGMARRAETSIRMALGAQRKRLIRQMLTESIVLSCLGGIAGLAVAYVGRRCCWRWRFRCDTTCRSMRVRHRLCWLCVWLSLLTGLIFGVAPGVGDIALAAGRGAARIEPVDATIARDGCSGRW